MKLLVRNGQGADRAQDGFHVLLARPWWLVLVGAVAINAFALLYITWLNPIPLPLDGDEAGTALLVQRPILDMLEPMKAHLHVDPPLFYLLLHGWGLVFGYGEIALRVLPLLFWPPTLVFIFLTARRLSTSRAAFLAVTIAAFMPYHWLYPVIVRWYSLAGLLAVASFYLLLRIIDSPAGDRSGSQDSAPVAGTGGVPWGAVGAYVATGTLFLYTNYAAAAHLLLHGLLAVLVLKKPGKLKPLLVAFACIALLYLPWMPLLVDEAMNPARWSLEMPLRQKVGNLIYSSLGLWVGIFGTPWHLHTSIPALLASGALIGLLPKIRGRAVWPWIMVVGMVVALAVAGIFWMRYLYLLTPLVAVGVGVLLDQVWGTRRRRLASMLVALTILCWAGALVNLVTRTGWSQPGWYVDVVRPLRALSQQSSTFFLTNADAPAYYLGDADGTLQTFFFGLGRPVATDRGVFAYDLQHPEGNRWLAIARERSRQYDKLTLIYSTSHPSPATELEKIKRIIESWGFRESDAQPIGYWDTHPAWKGQLVGGTPSSDFTYVVISYESPRE